MANIEEPTLRGFRGQRPIYFPGIPLLFTKH